MANIYPVKTSAGELVLPTANATLYTDTMSADYPATSDRALVQSYARTYPQGISLVTSRRPAIKSVSIQNRDNKPIYFWHGRISAGVLGNGALLAIDPATWTEQQRLDAAVFVKAYGEAIAAGATFEPKIAHAGVLYSVVEVGTAIASVKEGL